MEEVEKHRNYVMNHLDRNGDNKIDKNELRLFLMGATRSQPHPFPTPAGQLLPKSKANLKFKYVIMFAVFAFILYLLIILGFSSRKK